MTYQDLKNFEVDLVDSIDKVLALKEWLGIERAHNAIAFDTETTGLVVGKDRVRLVQIGDDTHGWSIPFERWGGLFEDVVRVWEGDWIAHNAKYDVGMLAHEGIQMPRDRVWDTRILHQVLYPHMSGALKPIAARIVHPAADFAQKELDEAIGARGPWTWATVPINFEPYWRYGAMDTVITWLVFDRIKADALTLAPQAVDIEHAILWVIERMERYGAHIDRAFAAQKLSDFETYVEQAAKWVKDLYEISPGSNAAIVRALQEAGFEFDKYTASGAIALDKDVLSGIDHPLAQTVLQRRQIQKLASTYLQHFVDDPDENDIIHPSINTLGARTGRMSMERPNLQNLPRKSESSPAANVVRSCVTAREGQTMLMCDFDQVEMRMLASLANVPAMIEAFRGPTDFFAALARLVYDDPTIEKKDPRRQITKGLGYATIYGAGVEKFAKQAGISVARAQEVRIKWNQMFPEVSRFQQLITNTTAANALPGGFVSAICPITGRRQVSERGAAYKLVNFLIQGAAASVLKLKLIELDQAGLGPYMVVPVHDEIIIDVPDDMVADAARILQEVMNDQTMFQVPLTASVSYGKTWGSKENYRAA